MAVYKLGLRQIDEENREDCRALQMKNNSNSCIYREYQMNRTLDCSPEDYISVYF
jgi:hypothetical protein